MKSIRIAIVLGIATLLCACAEAPPNSEAAGKASVADTSTIIYRKSVGGYGPAVPPSQKLVAYTLSAKGQISREYQDGHSVRLAQFDEVLVAALATQLNNIGDANQFELKSDTTGAVLCDSTHLKELRVNGTMFAIEEQPNCGALKRLALKAGMTGTLPAGTKSVNNLGYAISHLVDAIISAQMTATQ